MDSNTHSTRHPGRDPSGVAGAGHPAPGPGRPGPEPAERRHPGRTGPGVADSWPTAWTASGWPNSPSSMPGGPPGPRRASRSAPPPAGCGPGYGVESTAASCVRTARALYRGPLTATGQALADGELSMAHAQVLAHGTQDLPDHVAAEAEPVLLEAARRLDPPRLRRVIGHLRRVADPDGADRTSERQHQRRGVAVADLGGHGRPPGVVGPRGRPDPARRLGAVGPPNDAQDARSGGQRHADALTELARRNLESCRLPQSGGLRAQLLVTVDLDSLLSHPVAGWGDRGPWPLDPETCRRLACDAAVTRVLVTRHPTHQDPGDDDHPAAHYPGERPG